MKPFSKVPKELITTDDERIFVYHYICSHEYLWDNTISSFSLDSLCTEYSICTKRGIGRPMHRIKEILIEMVSKGYMTPLYKTNIHTAKLTTMLCFQLTDYFNPKDNFVLLYDNEVKTILAMRGCSRNTLLGTFLYIKSYISNAKQTDDTVLAFFRPMNSICSSLNISRTVCGKCLSQYVSKGLLYRYEAIKFKSNSKESFMPNIYILPENNNETNVKNSIKYVKNLYGLD